MSAAVAGVKVREIENCYHIIQQCISEGLQVTQKLLEYTHIHPPIMVTQDHHNDRYYKYHCEVVRDVYLFALENVKQDMLESTHLQEDLKAVIHAKERKTGVRLIAISYS